MDPITLALAAFSKGGLGSNLLSVFGKKKRKTIDPNWLKQTFGAGAVNEELQNLFNRAINSVQGQQLMTSAAESGQQFQSDIARAGAQAGLGPGGGATGGADIFASAGAGQAENNLQRGMRASLMQSMLPIAQQLVQDRMSAYMADYEGVQRNPYQDTPLSMAGDVMSNPMGSQQGFPMIIPGMTPQVSPGGPPISGGAPLPSPGQPMQASMKPSRLGGGTEQLGAPSMRDTQQQLLTQGRPSRFMSKMSRFSGLGGNVQQVA